LKIKVRDPTMTSGVQCVPGTKEAFLLNCQRTAFRSFNSFISRFILWSLYIHRAFRIIIIQHSMILLQFSHVIHKKQNTLHRIIRSISV